MSWDRVAGDWQAMGGKIKDQWGELTEADLTEAGASREGLLARIRERYGLGQEEAERRVAEWEAQQRR